MASTYDNDLRLNEMATGDGSGTWGETTNLNLSMIAEAFSYQTEATFASNADVTATIADGASDKYRGMYVKVTSGATLTTTRTLTIGPTTISKLIFVENATSGSQSIIVKQGSGATVTIATGTSKICFLEGTGSGAGVIDGLDKIALTSNATINGETPISASSTTTFTNKTYDADATGNSLTNIENANIKASAAIAFSKMANLTASKALQSDGNGDVSASGVTNTELGYLAGASSAIQTQINTKTSIATVYPVGSIYINASNSTNPASLLGFGTWAAFGAGRVMVGIDSGNAVFDAAEETGGTADSIIPSHTHSVTDPGHAHNITIERIGGTFGSGEFVGVNNGPGTTGVVGNRVQSAVTGISIASAGESATNKNLQPYIVVYMWKRTG